MNRDKSDYRRGLIYFGRLVFCICLFFTTPDGDTLFYKILGLFGISPGIRIGDRSTLYIYMLIPLIFAILSIKKILKHWWNYGSRFRDYNFFLRYLPFIIFVALFFISSEAVHPSVADRIYFSVIGQRGGLKSVTYHSKDNNSLRYEFNGNTWTYFCDLTFENHGDEQVEFYVKLTPNRPGGYQADFPEPFSEAFIKDEAGDNMIFILAPKQRIYYAGEFTDYNPTQEGIGNGSGESMFSVVLVNDNEQYSPKPIIRW